MLFINPGFLVSSQEAGEGGESATSVSASGSSADTDAGAPAEAYLPMDVLVVTSPSSPVVRGSLSVTILADHPLASQVTVRPPRFPPTLILERVRTEARYITHPGRLDESGPAPEPARWTAVEFLFTPLASGALTIEPFEVTAAGKRAATGTISLRIAAEPGASRRNAPVFRWETPPSSLVIGAPGDIALALNNWDLQKPIPRFFLQGKTSANTIMEELPFEGAGADGIIRYRFRLIPLEGDALVLGPLPVQAEGLSLEVPRLSIALAPAAAAQAPAASTTQAAPSPAAPSPAAPSPAAEENDETMKPLFPELSGNVFPLFRKEYEKIAGNVKILWEEGRYASALALIRKNERDSLPGAALAVLRRNLEQSLGFSFTEDERWRPWKVPAFSWLVVILLAAGVLVWKISVTSHTQRGYKKVTLLVVAGGLAILLLLGGLGDRMQHAGGGRSAVLEKTAAYRVPESGGAVNARFSEGQPVDIRSSRGEWVYAESMDGRSGWIPSAAVIPY
ncbi:bacterial SH3 domain family protein [Leadbettera azotonutricia ZAS-9]|uniref:Bacterial SH3 domain family protein n=2 Tax=Leadbettera azotonutricia TaxID=150829 RepID=F5Y7Q7_LEAAZ|nr:bacterial SH3 domain family protein [Leadbettera azotonutricia ZAS-9]